jgi:hypothetical protein
MTSEEKFAKILNRVRALLDLADNDGATPAEAALARAKAEQLMREYRIEEETALARDPQAMKPEMSTVQLNARGNLFQTHYIQLFSDIAMHVGIRTRFVYDGGFVVAQAVGYASDLRYAELLFTTARIVFSEHLEPAPDANLSEEENVYRLRRAGIERNRIATLLWRSSPKDGAAHGKVARIYKAECERRGETAALSGRTMSAKLYRETYADGFTERLRDRLWKARQGADTLGGLPALHGRKERVDEAFYSLFPELKPSPVAAEDSVCAKCEKRKDATPCAAHRARRWTKADEAAYLRRTASDSALAGRAAGADAAEKVELNGTSAAKRITERDTTRAVRGVLGD